MRVAHGVTDYQTTITTAAPHARDRASERALSQRAAHACVRGGGRETVMTCVTRVKRVSQGVTDCQTAVTTATHRARDRASEERRRRRRRSARA